MSGGSVKRAPRRTPRAAARPAGVTCRAAMSLRKRSLFISDHGLPGLRGENRCAKRRSSMPFCWLSIQPKHRASSTASLYEMRGLPLAFR